MSDAGTEAIRLTRGPGGEVEVTGPLDDLAAAVLRHAGFQFEPALRGHWIRLPFDLGRDWENEHATWAAEMLTAARYPIHLDPDLAAYSGQTAPPGPTPPPTPAPAPPKRRPHR